MKPAVKFLFDTNFDAVAAPARSRADAAELPAQTGTTRDPPAPAAPPPPLSFSEAELAAARQEARAQGLAEGEALALTSIAQANAATLAAIREALPPIAEQIQGGTVIASRHMLETTLAGLRRLMPELNRRGGLAEIEGLLQETISHLRNESRIVIRLHESLLDSLRADIDTMAQAAGFEGKLVLLADDDITPGDCRIEWADGGVERIASRIWHDIEAAVKRAIAAEATPVTSTPVGAPDQKQKSVTTGPSAGNAPGELT